MVGVAHSSTFRSPLWRMTLSRLGACDDSLGEPSLINRFDCIVMPRLPWLCLSISLSHDIHLSLSSLASGCAMHSLGPSGSCSQWLWWRERRCAAGPGICLPTSRPQPAPRQRGALIGSLVGPIWHPRAGRESLGKRPTLLLGGSRGSDIMMRAGLCGLGAGRAPLPRSSAASDEAAGVSLDPT